MAGAGYKLFNTGDVLTAAQVNTYLMEQTTMVFADAAARTAALTGVVAEGMISYLKSTKQVEVYNGSAWVASDDPNAIQNTIVDAKGDLISATGNDVPARLAVGNNGETLVADSSATTGLRWQGNFAAGKNAVINGDFRIWQRGTTFNNVVSGTWTSDRFVISSKLGTHTTNVTQQTFTPGTAPVSGYEGATFIQLATTGYSSGDYYLATKIEDVRTFAGQTVTLSYWARVTSGTHTPNRVFLNQQFGSGGSAEVDNIGAATPTYTTTWQRFTHTISVPSISGKTIGAGSYLYVLWQFVPSGNPTVQIWGVQLEAGSVATAFQTATGTLAGELAACQRYYVRWNSGTDPYARSGQGIASSTTRARILISHPVFMRGGGPASVDYSTQAVFDGVTVTGVTSVTMNSATALITELFADVSSGLTQYRNYQLLGNNSTSAFLGLSAEL